MNLLQLNKITKRYPGVVALSDVSINFEQGEVHALLGENGAGKSTLIKILSGAISPDNGEIVFDGKTITDITPALAQSLGIGVIYQEFTLVPSLSIAENIFLGNEICMGVRIDKQKMAKEAEKILQSLEINIDPNTKVKNLSVAYQQIVEIAKSISKNVRVLIMDEPTAPLTNNEVTAMFKLVRKLVENNVTIIYISHRMEELFEISNRITILRDGKYIETLNTSETNKDELVKLMVGRPLTEQYPKRENIKVGKVLLEVKNLNTEAMLKNINISVCAGEILGISGLVGAGRTELARAIFGADKIQEGDVYLGGEKISCRSPKDAIERGIALIPEDRKQQGLLLNMSVGHNITIASIKNFLRFGVIRKYMENTVVGDYIKKLAIKTPNMAQLARNLSGGNQQKIVIAKWLASESKVYIFDEPTRGIDVGAKYEIYCQINRLVEQGNAVIMISSELPEILGMSDRIVVMCEGKIIGELSRNDATQDAIMRLASGI